MPIQRRTDGFSADGLRYSVASDFDKQIGQALAEQEARMRDPRFIPGARVESPDSPDLLRQELIDPVLTAFGVNTERIASNRNPLRGAPRLYEMGNELISVDPMTQQTKVVHTAPEKPVKEETYRVPTQMDAFGKPGAFHDVKASELAEFADTLPDIIRTNSPVSTYMERERRKGTQQHIKPGQRGKLSREMAEQFRQQAKGDKALARQLAKEAGYDF